MEDFSVLLSFLCSALPTQLGTCTSHWGLIAKELSIVTTQ